MRSLRLAVVSDIHAGDIVRNKNISVLADKLNMLNPDCIIIAGDLFDHSVDSVIASDVLRPLASVHSKFGTFVAFGNHDYFDNGDKAQKYAETLNFTILRDRTVCIGGSFYITGREDFSVTRRIGKKRTPLTELLTGVNRNYPIILIDHQPNMLRDAVENNIDLQVSGHTHNGQFWPVNFITDFIYDLPYGHKRISSTDFIVTSGAGTWGPPVRTTGRSEIACIDITFTKK
jgi:predicted MPP superfamily phosphohydrolase